MARALLITNPAAARTAPGAVRTVVDTLRGAGWSAEVLATGGPGDARRLAAQAVADQVDVVAVFGGDGTAMQAAAALVHTDTALGLIPGGTGNLLAGNMRIPASPARAARALVSGRRRQIDLGRVDRPEGSHHFAVACGAGYDARVMAETASVEKRKWGMGAYVATTFRLLSDLRSAAHVITVDGVEYEANAALVLVANCAEVIPPFVKLGAGISPEDGLLDVVALRANNVGESVRAIWDLLRQGSPGGGFVGYARGREVRIESVPVEPVELDGEPEGTTPFTATVVPGALTVMVPGDA